MMTLTMMDSTQMAIAQTMSSPIMIDAEPVVGSSDTSAKPGVGYGWLNLEHSRVGTLNSLSLD